MLPELPKMVPNATCLDCEGCCRFDHAGSVWRPRATAEERAALAPGGGQAPVTYLTTQPCQSEGCRCVYLNEANNHCRAYARRPFECRLYPFVLARRPAGLYLTVHLSCPHIQTIFGQPVFQDLVQQLRAYFQDPAVQAFLIQYPSLAGPYEAYATELADIFLIDTAGAG